MAAEAEPSDRIKLLETTLEKIDQFFFADGIDKLGRGILLVEMVDGMGKHGDFNRRQTAELQQMFQDYITDEG
jgi:hypothetical protein